MVAAATLLTCFIPPPEAAASSLADCVDYIRFGLPSDKGVLLCRLGYALAHNPERKTPDWVAERLTREKAERSLPRTDDFRPDPDLEPGQRAELVDYKNAGLDRGHMAPAADMRWDKEAMSQSFFLSNMVPQVGVGMNRGIWKDLEEGARNWAISRGEVHIFTGPIYQGTTKTIGSNKVGVPSHVYKIVFDPVRIEAIAFLMPNKALQARDMPTYIVTIDEIEAKTGLDFLSEMQEEVEQLIESRKAAALWE